MKGRDTSADRRVVQSNFCARSNLQGLEVERGAVRRLDPREQLDCLLVHEVTDDGALIARHQQQAELVVRREAREVRDGRDEQLFVCGVGRCGGVKGGQVIDRCLKPTGERRQSDEASPG